MEIKKSVPYGKEGEDAKPHSVTNTYLRTKIRTWFF